MHKLIPPPKTVGNSVPTDYEVEYQKNWLVRQAQMAKLVESISPLATRERNLPDVPKSPRPKNTMKRKSVTGQVAPRRRSLRHQGVENGTIKYYGSEIDSEPESASPKIPRTIRHIAGPPTPLLVEDVTPDLLANIAQSCSDKIYSQNGTTCHQCRQKTLDTKTVCRAANCVGVRGQFCQQCLSNHYGENVRDALLDKDWSCPSCREICNCSICRTRKNKLPLGLIIHVARDNGFSNVHEFIKSEEGDSDNDAPNVADNKKNESKREISKTVSGELGNMDINDSDASSLWNISLNSTLGDMDINENDPSSSYKVLVVDKEVYDEFERKHYKVLAPQG